MYICVTKANNMEALISKIRNFNNEMLIDILKGLNSSFGFEQDLVFDLALSELENRMDEVKFIELCNSL